MVGIMQDSRIQSNTRTQVWVQPSLLRDVRPVTVTVALAPRK